MRKILLLPLAALLCIGCTKESMQSDRPDAAKQNASQAIDLIFYNEVDNFDYTNDSYIEYEDVSGQRQAYYPEEGRLSHFLSVKANSMLTIHAKIRHKDASKGTPIDCKVLRVEELGCDPVRFGYFTSIVIDAVMDIQVKLPLYAHPGDPCQIYLRVDPSY